MSKIKLNAEHYQKHSTIQKRLAAQVLEYHSISSKETILDIGCGDGAITASMAEEAMSGNVLGIDASNEMIALANKTYSTQLSNLTYKQALAEDGHGENQYSLITSFNCLYWVKPLEQAFENIYKALKPGGHFLALVYPLESVYWKPFIDVLHKDKFKQYCEQSICSYWRSSSDWIRLAESRGFEVIRSDREEQEGVYVNDQAYLDYVNGWLPCLLDAPALTLEDYLRDVLALVKTKFSKNEELSIPFTKLHLYLKKPR
jgi:trans-aconitate methyltransferase